MTECEICYEERNGFESCTRCVHDWCTECHPSLHQCPFCRLPLRRVDRFQEYRVQEEIRLQVEFETDEWIGYF